MALIFDIETIADPTVIPLLPEPTAPSNYKDADKIAAYIAEAKQRQIETLALKPWGCRIVALGADTSGTPFVGIAENADVEGEVLEGFWEYWNEHGSHVGYNIVGFDLPVLIVRSRMLGIRVPHIGLTKYRADETTDLMLCLHPNGEDFKSLTFWCKRLGLDVPDDPSSGADIATFVANGEWSKVIDHCQIDLIKTRALYDRLYPKSDDTF